MKRIIAFLLAAMLLLLAGCSRKGENTEEGFVDTKTGIEYVYCTPMGLYPVNPETDEDENPIEYLSVENRDGSKTVFYKVEYENPENFLCYSENGFYFLAHNKNVAEPTVKEFAPIAASIYNSANTGYIASFWADNKYLPDDLKEHNPSEDTWLCELIAENLTNGEHVEVPASEKDITDLFYIRLLSQKYPGLFYLVSFFGYNGRYFLRNGATGKTVYCPREVILRMVGE